MDVKYIGGEDPWTIPFGDHFNSSSQTALTDTYKTNFTSASNLDEIARRHGFEPLYATNDKQSEKKGLFANGNSQWMNSGILFTDKTINPSMTGIHKTDFSDQHGHTFCYLCSINQHDHEHTKPRAQSQRRKLIPYNNPKALKIRPSSADRPAPLDPSTSSFTPYRFIVRTGTKENSGTRAQVFLYMYGTERDWTSVNLRARTNPTVDGFPSGSIRTFCLKGPDIGQLRHLNVNLVGARSDKEWFLKEIEITNLHTSVTWLCEFNCWLPKNLPGRVEDEQHYHVKPTINPQKELSFEHLSVYILQVRTGGRSFAGTDSNIQVVIRGSESQTRRLQLTSDGADLFEQNQLDTFAIVGWDLGDLSEITVESDKTQMASDWDLKDITMWKILPNVDHKQFQVYFPFNTWLGKKVNTIKAKAEKQHASSDHHLRGPTCYHIAVKTGSAMTAGTDANVFIIIYGSSGRTSIHQLDNRRKNDFERNTTSEFMIMDIDVGRINQIKVWHDNSNIGSSWFLDTIIIRKKHSTCRPVTNVYVQRLEQISKILYDQACEQLRKNHKVRMSSPNENEHRSKDRKSSQFRDYDDSDNSRSILRTLPVYDKTNLHKKVTWNEHSIGSQDDLLGKSTKPTGQKHVSSSDIQSGHYEHYAHWISSHSYTDNKWKINSIEEHKSYHLDQSVRSLLLADRTAISSKIKTPVQARDDDVYEFEANRWLAKDKNDNKLEVYLTPKSSQLSTHTNNETKTKSTSSDDTKKKPLSPSTRSSSDIRYDDEHLKRSSPLDLGTLQRSPRSFTSSDKSMHDITKTHGDELRSSQRHYQSTTKRHEESLLDKYQRPASPSQHTKPSRFDNDLRATPSPSQQTQPSRLDNDRHAAPSPSQHTKPSRFDNDLRATPSPSQQTQPSRLDNDRHAAPSSSQHSKPSRFENDRYTTPSPNQQTQPSRLDNDRHAAPSSSQHSKPFRFDNDLRATPSPSQQTQPSRLDNDRHAALSPSQHSKPSRFENDRYTTPSPSQQIQPSRLDSDRHATPSSSQHTKPSRLDNDHHATPSPSQHTKPSRLDNNLLSMLTPSQRELMARISSDPYYQSRPAATSVIDTGSSELYNQRSKSPRSNETSLDPSHRPKSAARSMITTSSHQQTRTQVYNSAYGTLSSDKF